MFSCQRCGSRYSATHAAAIESCPRCLIRDRVSAPLVPTSSMPRPGRPETEAKTAGGGTQFRSPRLG
jgi:hypothetical protein